MLKSIDYDKVEHQNLDIVKEIHNEKDKKKLEKLYRELQIKLCPLKRFVSLFYSQIFIESLNLSFNEGIEESFA